MGPIEIILIILAIVVFLVVIFSIKVVRQSTVVVVERLGKFRKILETGIHFVLPFFEKASKPISLKERVADFAPQPVITLRNLVGELELDGTLTSRDTVNSKMRSILDEATDPWGIKINRVELKNILPPQDIQNAMEKQMRAERERREAILKAEGEKRSNILVAEGEKEAMILRAEAKKASVIAEAEATATAIKMINDANPNAAYLTLQGYEALKSVANGKSTKLIVPSEIQNISGLLASMKEVLSLEKTDEEKK